ncbi:MAG: hypothetical protein ITG00_11345 [Flavobacterium sp.]|nr:hypothetical protein [Flavobacterium sp.]
MNDTFKPIIAALVKEGFHQIPSEENSGGKTLDFNITPYSLNTPLSFKFDNLPHFIEFLKMSQKVSDEKIELMRATLQELDLDESKFFYVNFFEKNKEVEM